MSNVAPLTTLKFVLLALFVALTLVVYAWIGNPFDSFDDEQFSRKAWQKAANDVNSRACMSRDLVRHVIKSGMSEKEVVTLLGRPDSTSGERGPSGKLLTNVHTYVYRIGNWPGMNMDDAFVYVYLDPSKRVIQSEIHGY